MIVFLLPAESVMSYFPASGNLKLKFEVSIPTPQNHTKTLSLWIMTHYCTVINALLTRPWQQFIQYVASNDQNAMQLQLVQTSEHNFLD